MTDTSYTQWCNENCGRAYPLADDCPAAGVLSPRILSDAGLVSAEPGVPYVSRVVVTPAVLSVIISLNGVDSLLFAVARSAVTPYAPVPGTQLDDRVTGWIAFGDLTDAPDGTWVFQPGEAPFALRAWRYAARPGVRAFVQSGSGATTTSSIVTLSVDSNLAVRFDESANTIWIGLSAEGAKAFKLECASAGIESCGSSPLRTINKVQADADGRLTLELA